MILIIQDRKCWRELLSKGPGFEPGLSSKHSMCLPSWKMVIWIKFSPLPDTVYMQLRAHYEEGSNTHPSPITCTQLLEGNGCSTAAACTCFWCKMAHRRHLATHRHWCGKGVQSNEEPDNDFCAGLSSATVNQAKAGNLEGQCSASPHNAPPRFADHNWEDSQDSG